MTPLTAPQRRQRRQIWRNVAGCACPSNAKPGDRCTMSAVRCNERLARICEELDAAGIARGAM